MLHRPWEELHVGDSLAGEKAALPWRLGKGPHPSVVWDWGARGSFLLRCSHIL